MVVTAAHINPDSLVHVAILGRIVRQFCLDLRGNKGKHVLTSTEEDLSGSIISPGLLLVEAFKGILLIALFAALVGFDERGVEEKEEGFDQAWAFVLTLNGEN